MAKPARGLPSDFSLDLPDDGPVVIGDFLDEAPPAVPAPRKPARVAPLEKRLEPVTTTSAFRPEVVSAPKEEKQSLPRPMSRNAVAPSIIRYQLNLTPKAKTMLEELVEYVKTYSPEADTRTSEVFQGIMGLLHSAMGELELSDLPRRGAWGSVTAKNFPGALSEAFEQAILRAAKK
jgi:hypothetical protein